MSNIIDSIQVSGVTYTIQGSGGGNPTVELTQAEYEALVESGAVQTNTYYIITDAQAGDLTQYWTSAQTSSAITSAVSTKQDTLVSGTNIKTINNESLLGSGNIEIQTGSTYTAGRGININASNVVSVSLPISAGTGENSIAEGFNTTASGLYSHAEGNSTVASGYRSHAEGYATSATSYQSHAEGNHTLASGLYSHAEGTYTAVNNEAEHASGKYNVSGNDTLFSVGNGTADNARHNAFEIKQNGDIYLNDGTNDVKLQDTITATAANTTALGGLKLVKLTQTEYDALSPNYDSNTLYVIVN